MALDLRDRIANRLRDLVNAPLEKGPYQATTLAIAVRPGDHARHPVASGREVRASGPR